VIVDEVFVVFDAGTDACIGVVSRPAANDASNAVRLGVMIVVGGPQYRVGSHRQFALLARDLAAAGIPALRFDYRGMGDSQGEARTFEDVDEDLGAAIAAFKRAAQVDRIVLWGLCDGASAALIYAARDASVGGVVAANPWARNEVTQATARLTHYYSRRLFAADFWRKAIGGRIDTKTVVTHFARTVRSAASGTQTEARDYLARMHAGWKALACPALFILSSDDLTAREFEVWVAADPLRRELMRNTRTEVLRVAQADHTFSTRIARAAMTQGTVEWIKRLAS
jgi:exosortase A-associated hydrolase 1